jgi:hypothetical protein
MYHKNIPTERCHRCQRHNQVVFNKRELLMGFGMARVLLCDACHKHMLEHPSRPKMFHTGNISIKATDENLLRLLSVLSTEKD